MLTLFLLVHVLYVIFGYFCLFCCMYINCVFICFVCLSVGICQSYVSRYMKGDIYDMSERSRHAILKWYLIYRKNPAAIGSSFTHILFQFSRNPSVFLIIRLDYIKTVN